MTEEKRVWVVLPGDKTPVRTSAKTTRLIQYIAGNKVFKDYIYFYPEGVPE